MKPACLYFFFLSFLQLVCSCVWGGRSSDAGDRASIHYRKGKTLQQDFYLLGASDHFLEALRTAGTDSVLVCLANLELGRISGLLVQYADEARFMDEAFRAAVAVGSDTLLAEVFHERGLIALRGRDFPVGRSCLREAIRLSTDSARRADCEKDMARLSLLAGEHDSALSYVRRAIARCPRSQVPPSWRLLKGDVFLAMQATDSARACLAHEDDGLPLAEHAGAARSMARLCALEGDREGELMQWREYVALRESLAAGRKGEMMEKIHIAREYRQQRERVEQAEKAQMEKEVVLHRVSWGAAACILVLSGLYYRGHRNKQRLASRLQQERLKQMEIEMVLARERR